MRDAVPLAPGACVIDVGLGDTPVTTVEWSQSLGPSVEVLGVDSEPERVATAQVHATTSLRFSTVEAVERGRASLIRAMNVLRGGTVENARARCATWGTWLAESGLLVEGSTDTEGHVTAAQLLRRRGGVLLREGLLFHTDFTRGFSPWLFRDWLPREFRRGVTPVHAFLAAWSAVCDALPAGLTPVQRFEASVPQLHDVERVGSSVVWRSAPHTWSSWAPDNAARGRHRADG
ncbi:MAG: methylase [Archangium sp.]|nr:methylase [Archangium sp.]